MSRQERLKQLEQKKKDLETKIRKLERKLKRKIPSTHKINPPFTSVKDIGFHEVRGKRSNMEDGHCMIDGFRENSYEGYFGVYDGHSGKDAECGRTTVDFVEDNLHLNFEESLRECKSVFGAFIRAFKKTDHGLRNYNCFGNGSTVVSCYLTQAEDLEHPNRRNKLLYTANAGDSRAILSRGGKAIRLSFDHKASDKSEEDRILAADGSVSKGRVMGTIAVSRSLGDHAVKGWVVADPYCSKIKIIPEDDMLILACDGVWDVMEDQDGVDFCRSLWLDKGMNCGEIAKALVDKSLEDGSKDNITVIVILLNTDK